MADNDLKVIVKAKKLAVHSFKLTSNCNRYPKKYRHSLVDRIQIKSLDIYETLFEAAQRKFVRMAKLVVAGKLPLEKFQASYNSWKNHISRGNCYRLGKDMDERINRILQTDT